MEKFHHTFIYIVFQTKQRIATLRAAKSELAKGDFSLELSNKPPLESIHAKRKKLHLTFLEQSLSSSASSLSTVSPYSVSIVSTCIDGETQECHISWSDLARGSNVHCGDDISSKSITSTHTATSDISLGSEFEEREKICNCAAVLVGGSQSVQNDTNSLLTDSRSCVTAMITPEFFLFDVEALIRESRKRCELPE